LGRIKS